MEPLHVVVEEGAARKHFGLQDLADPAQFPVRPAGLATTRDFLDRREGHHMPGRDLLHLRA